MHEFILPELKQIYIKISSRDYLTVSIFEQTYLLGIEQTYKYHQFKLSYLLDPTNLHSPISISNNNEEILILIIIMIIFPCTKHFKTSMRKRQYNLCKDYFTNLIAIKD